MRAYLIHKDRPNDRLFLLGEKIGIRNTNYGFSLHGRQNNQDVTYPINLDLFKKSSSENHEDFIWINIQ